MQEHHALLPFSSSHLEFLIDSSLVSCTLEMDAYSVLGRQLLQIGAISTAVTYTL